MDPPSYAFALAEDKDAGSPEDAYADYYKYLVEKVLSNGSEGGRLVPLIMNCSSCRLVWIRSNDGSNNTLYMNKSRITIPMIRRYNLTIRDITYGQRPDEIQDPYIKFDKLIGPHPFDKCPEPATFPLHDLFNAVQEVFGHSVDDATLSNGGSNGKIHTMELELIPCDGRVWTNEVGRNRLKMIQTNYNHNSTTINSVVEFVVYYKV